METSEQSQFDATRQLLDRYWDRFSSGRGEPLSAEEGGEIYQALEQLQRRFLRVAKISDGYQSDAKGMVERLEKALSGATFLGGIFRICASCKKLCNDEGKWQQFEQYITDRSETFFSHSICPACASGAYGIKSEKKVDETASISITEEDLTDSTVVKFSHIISSKLFEDAALYREFRELFSRYHRQARRMMRIARISDSFQGELRELSRKLEKASRTDPLTGINNRGYFMQLLSAEMERSRRHGRTFSVMMVDLDHFKKINDCYGHAAGDAALLFFVATLENSGFRKSDFWGRLGGEEFAVVVPETLLDQALLPAERIRSMLAKAEVRHEDASFTVTASIGVSQYLPGDTAESLLSRADQAMYRAKEEGRNRVCSMEYQVI